MKIDKHLVLKLLLLMVITLKVSFAVYQNVYNFSNSEEIAFFLEIDDSEKQENIEFDESEKIHQKINTSISFTFSKKEKQYAHILFDYKTKHKEYTTPPPEIG